MNSKRAISLLLAMLMLLTVLAGCSVQNNSADNKEETKNESSATAEENKTEENKDGEASKDYHIGIITGTASQGEDELRAAQYALEKYGSVADGGMINHDTYPDNFMAEQETTISKIVAMADDPKMKAIIVNQSVPGTVAAFQQVREKRPDILLVDVTPQEDPLMVSAAADLVVDADNVSRGYRIIAAAKEMGATKFVHISFPRHMSIELLALRRAIMEEAAKELGIEFISETAPDPTGDVGIPGAQQFIAENIPNWIKKYGKDTAFFCTNDAHTEPLLRGIAEGGAIFVEQDLPSPIMGYPGAFSMDLKKEMGDWPAINKKVEETVIAAGGGGRMGSWSWSLGYSNTLAALDLVMNVLDNGADITNKDELVKSLEAVTEPGIWMASNYKDRASGEFLPNYLLIAQDTYVYGRGHLGMNKVEVPEKYLNINVEVEKAE